MKKLILMLAFIFTLNFVSVTYADSETLAEKEIKKADKLKNKQEKAVRKAAKKMNIKTVEAWANAGDVQAQMILSYAYQNGLSVDKNSALAAEWKTRATRTNLEYVKNFMPSEYRGKRIQLAKLYGIAAYRAQVGYYVKPDYESAVSWAELGASEQDTMSLSFLGSAYYTGRGVRQDYNAAMEYFKLSQDEPLTLTLLSDAYAKGHGVEKDLKKSKLYNDYLNLVRQEKIGKQKAQGEKRSQDAQKRADRALSAEDRKNPFSRAKERADEKLAEEKDKIAVEMAKQAAAEKNELLKEEVERIEGKTPAPATETPTAPTPEPEKPATETPATKNPPPETEPEKEIKPEDLPEVSAPFEENKKSAEK